MTLRYSSDDDDEDFERVSAKVAGYMELPGAKKDGDCERVEVAGGVAKALGCCNLFGWNSRKKKLFSCGTCKYVT